MSTDQRPRRSLPFGTLLLFTLACVLYVAMLANIRFSSGGGDAAMGDAFALLFLTFGLWIALALLLIVGAVMGKMPRWTAIAAIFLLPLSGVATFVAIDMCSRHIASAIIFPISLPLLIALYAGWARTPTLHAALPADNIGIIAWGLIFILSAAAILLAM